MRPSDPASTTAASSGLEVCVARAKGSLGDRFFSLPLFLFIYDAPVSGEKGISHTQCMQRARGASPDRAYFAAYLKTFVNMVL